MANEEVKRIVMGLCPIDDECMKVIFKNNNPLAEYVLRIILNRSDLIVEKCEVKYELDDFGSHRVFLDVFARDNEGKPYSVEIRRIDSGVFAKRARYHSAALDITSASTAKKLSEIPDSYMIFITENDIFNGNCPRYHMDRVIVETNELFQDGAHIIYLNGAYQDVESAIGKLIHDFSCRSAEDMLCQPIAEVIKKYKNTYECLDVCKAVEEYGMKQRNEGVQEGIAKSIMRVINQGKLSYDEIAEGFDVPVDEVRKLAAQMN